MNKNFDSTDCRRRTSVNPYLLENELNQSITKDSVIRPVTPMSESSLFRGSDYEPNMLGELKKEIQTSDSIDMLVSFIKWSGLRCIINELETFTNQGGHLRVITNRHV